MSNFIPPTSGGGWIIQGVRGEGKSLCAVGMIRAYALQGRMIATNLDIFPDKLLPADNDTVIYRLPDKPRHQDFQALPPACDVDYKGADKNGLLVLDECGTWLNSRSWNDKERLPMINWLFLSRKLHWDLVILCQDADTIDTQIRSTLCDYLVISSRLDRQKIPYLAPLLDLIGINSFLPKIHTYFVFYGFNTQQKPTDTWQFLGTDLYEGYNTNQLFKDGLELVTSKKKPQGELIDTRAIKAYLPASRLSGEFYIRKHQQQIESIRDLFNSSGDDMAVKKGYNSNKIKIYLLCAFLVFYLIYRLFSGFNLPTANKALTPAVQQPTQTQPALINASYASASVQQPVQQPQPTPQPVQNNDGPVKNAAPEVQDSAPEVQDFLPYLLSTSRPRLSSYVYSEDKGFIGYIDFLRGGQVVEHFDFQELHALGVVLLKAPYGIEFRYKGKSYIVNYAPLTTASSHETLTQPHIQHSSPIKPECVIKPVMTKEEREACNTG